ncbi:MAG TPA: CapA family protein [Defluviitaleaceae bacterium]|jgi:poly-gamma-glutamate capsule biosynthesis protein CapA/YwtB (metallophosphatase superfamily)|nr:CapA family protein [Defluviitaleaceae bacterium]HPT76105.1 CapA family protein [Defluviitaleaceae bacterium]HQD49937.1 CapA family protein [Defluviitaleaceae bacterium]
MTKKHIILWILILYLILILSACNKAEKTSAENEALIKEDQVIENTDEELKREENEEEVTQIPEAEEPQKIVIAFMGDVMMDSYIGDYIRDRGVDYPWEDVASITQAADLAVINLETSVSTRGSTKKPEGYGFRSHPDSLQGLVNSGIDLVSLANNHSLDFGEEAFNDTLDYLDQYGIAYVGGGKNKNEAEQLKIIEKNGIQLGFLAFTSVIPWSSWEATEDKAGTAVYKEEYKERLLQNIENASKECDILTIIPHWGVEYAQVPSEWQRELAHEMIDAGADIIVGHHPHVLQGIEFYKEKPIFYSVGNFIFLKNDDLCGRTGIFQLTLDKDGFKKGEFYPVNIQYCKANLLNKKEGRGKEIIDMLRELSASYGTIINEEGEIQKP